MPAPASTPALAHRSSRMFSTALCSVRRFVMLNGEDVKAFIVSNNVKRRHLNSASERWRWR